MADFGFCGDAYTAPSIYQDAQELINWYCEIDPKKKAQIIGQAATRGLITLYPTLGLLAKLQLVIGEVRGLHVLPGGQTMLAVSANTLYSISSNFTPTIIGTLLTSKNPVSIKDNGISAYIVDGANRYYYTWGTNTFAVVPLTDGPFTGADKTDIVDNFFIYNRPGTNQWGASNALSTVSSNLSLGSKFSSSDNLVTLIVDHRDVYLLGEVTSEAHIDVGAFPFPFQIIPGTTIQHGCAAKNSVSRLGNSFAFLAQDTRGTKIVAQMEGYSLTRISTHAIENDLINDVVNDAIGYTWQIEGHEFYVLNFPTADKTWVYDGMTQMWHKWLSVDSFNNFHRHRSNCAASFQGLIIVGDYQNGMLYALSKTTFTDNANTIRRLRRCPHLVTDLQRQTFEELQLQFQPGVGLSIGQGSDPQAMLRWSDDGGSTWSKEHWVSIGKIGAYKNRAIWRRLGQARDRIFEVSITDPINAVIVSANLKASVEAN